MDATTALTFYAFLVQMLNRMPKKIVDLIFDSFVSSLGKNIIHIHHDMQTATIAIAGSTIVTRQPNGVTVMIHNRRRAAQVTHFRVVPILSMLLTLHLHDLLAQSAVAMEPNRRTSLGRTLLILAMSAVKRTSVIHLCPLAHRLTALPARDIFAKLVSVIIIIPLNYTAPRTFEFAQDRLQWIQTNIHLLQAHTAALMQLKLHVKFKDLAVDAMMLCPGPTSINQELINTMGSLLDLRGKHKLIGEYMVASSTTMANECADLEGIVAASGRNYIETYVDFQRRTVEVTVNG